MSANKHLPCARRVLGHVVRGAEDVALKRQTPSLRTADIPEGLTEGKANLTEYEVWYLRDRAKESPKQGGMHVCTCVSTHVSGSRQG